MHSVRSKVTADPHVAGVPGRCWALGECRYNWRYPVWLVYPQGAFPLFTVSGAGMQDQEPREQVRRGPAPTARLLFAGRPLLREVGFQFLELLLQLGRLFIIEVARIRLGPLLEGAFPFLFR